MHTISRSVASSLLSSMELNKARDKEGWLLSCCVGVGNQQLPSWPTQPGSSQRAVQRLASSDWNVLYCFVHRAFIVLLLLPTIVIRVLPNTQLSHCMTTTPPPSCCDRTTTSTTDFAACLPTSAQCPRLYRDWHNGAALPPLSPSATSLRTAPALYIMRHLRPPSSRTAIAMTASSTPSIPTSSRSILTLLLFLCCLFLSIHAQSASTSPSAVAVDNGASCLSCNRGGDCSRSWYSQSATPCGESISGVGSCCPAAALNGTHYYCTTPTSGSSTDFTCQTQGASADPQQWTTSMTIVTVVMLVLVVACCVSGAAILKCCMQATRPTEPTTIIISSPYDEDLPPAYEPPSHGHSGPLVQSNAHYVRM